MASVTDLTALRAALGGLGKVGAEAAVPAPPVIDTGIAALDHLLPDRGFPRGGISVIAGASGVGRMSLAAMLVQRETEAGRPVAWIDAGGTLYPPALALSGARLERVLFVRARDEQKAVRALAQVVESSVFSVVVSTGIAAGMTPVRARKVSSASQKAQVSVLMVVEEAARLEGAALVLQLSRRPEGIVVDLTHGRRAREGRAIVGGERMTGA
ncbi:MAG: hypothetical protein U1E65_32885 [Myxococcota bacterium]